MITDTAPAADFRAPIPGARRGHAFLSAPAEHPGCIFLQAQGSEGMSLCWVFDPGEARALAASLVKAAAAAEAFQAATPTP